jgi:hypothetical protein
MLKQASGRSKLSDDSTPGCSAGRWLGLVNWGDIGHSFTGGTSATVAAETLAAGALGGAALAGIGALDAAWWKDEVGILTDLLNRLDR